MDVEFDVVALLRSAGVAGLALALLSCSPPPDGLRGGQAQFVSCNEPTGPLLDSQILLDRLNAVQGFYVEPEEVIEVSCIWTSDAKIAGTDENLANNWVSITQDPQLIGLELQRYLAAPITRVSDTEAEGLLVTQFPPSIGIQLVFDGRSWLISEWLFSPSCDYVGRFVADVDSDTQAELLASCGS